MGCSSSDSAWISTSASVNSNKDKKNGCSLTHQVTLHSDCDTTLTGVQVNGKRIAAEIGHNLTLTSEQDSNRYYSK
ncbi:hypothetical protein HGT73_14490 [Rosenbergiella australiborealis]|uniref:Uncharacterized protein n=1 Tax=Rosenbergiella australiborealis TaxID=1544696 RepID=A0ABS5T844_9GAMM|nr:hypothetical protein [Rosenbergiella australiborealis]